MKIHTSSGIEIDVIWQINGDVIFNSSVPPRTYYNKAEELKGIYNDLSEILAVVKNVEKIDNGGPDILKNPFADDSDMFKNDQELNQQKQTKKIPARDGHRTSKATPKKRPVHDQFKKIYVEIKPIPVTEPEIRTELIPVSPTPGEILRTLIIPVMQDVSGDDKPDPDTKKKAQDILNVYIYEGGQTKYNKKTKSI